MKVLIIEDEILSAEHLTNMLKKIDASIEVVKIVDSIKTAVEFLQSEPLLDLMFVDIHLADGVSFEIFSKIAIDTPIVFTTAYSEYAIKAFKVNSIDYLLKPIGIEELRTAITKFKKSQGNYTAKKELAKTAVDFFHKQSKSRFMVKIGDNISSIKTEDIAHFIAEDGIVLLVTKSTGKRFPVDYTSDQLESMVDTDHFYRINRKVLISIDAIQKMSPYFNSRYKISSEHLKDDDGIVSRERVQDFKNWLDK